MGKVRQDLIESQSKGITLSARSGACRVARYKTSGGMAEVFEGTYGGQACIIKTPKESLDTNEREFKTQNRYLEREINALKNLSHPNIVRLLDFGEYKGENYLIEELLTGQTLQQYQDHRLDEDRAKRIILQVAKTLEFMHGKGFLYRDLSPDNVMENNLNVKLFDFGLAINGYNDNNEDVVDANRRTRGGHLYFSSFEQFNEGLSTPAGDVYSVGTLLWFLLTGKWPTEWGNFSPAVDVDVSEKLNDIVLIATSKDWKERYQTIGELIRAIELNEPRSKTLRGGVINIEGVNYPVTRINTVIGRADKHSRADINVVDLNKYITRCIPQVIPRDVGHCRVIRESGKYYLEDLNSKNGTWVLFDRQNKVWKKLGGDLPRKIRMNDGDVFSFAYNEKKGHYITFTFKDYGNTGGTTG